MWQPNLLSSAPARRPHPLFLGTVHGVFNSVAGVGGAVTDTVSKLTFDDEYQLKRERDKNKALANQGGVGQGLVQVCCRGCSTQVETFRMSNLLCPSQQHDPFLSREFLRRK